MDLRDDKVLKMLTEMYNHLEEKTHDPEYQARLDQSLAPSTPGAVIVVDGYPKNQYVSAEKGKFIGVVSNDAGANNLYIKTVKVLKPGITGHRDETMAAVDPKTAKVVTDINSLGLTPEELQILQSAVKEYSGKKFFNWQDGIDVTGGGRWGTD